MDSNVNKLSPNPQEATEFLKLFSPDDPWFLMGIWPKGIPGMPTWGKPILIRTFRPNEVDLCQKWVARINEAGWNVYFMVNPPKGMLSKKATKSDVKELRWLFVDIDPRPREPLNEERERILNRLTNKLPEGMPEPTFITDSGSGFWAFWKLVEPINMLGE